MAVLSIFKADTFESVFELESLSATTVESYHAQLLADLSPSYTSTGNESIARSCQQHPESPCFQAPTEGFVFCLCFPILLRSHISRSRICQCRRSRVGLD